MNQTHLKVRKSSAGLGLFTEKEILAGEFVIEYTGEKISNDEAQKRGGKYLFEINSKWTLDGKGREHTARYINYSHKPNCEARLIGSRIKLYACIDIPANSELTYDYGEEYYNEFIQPLGCKCGHCDQGE
jgi:uncharacterized protein